VAPDFTQSLEADDLLGIGVKPLKALLEAGVAVAGVIGVYAVRRCKMRCRQLRDADSRASPRHRRATKPQRLSHEPPNIHPETRAALSRDSSLIIDETRDELAKLLREAASSRRGPMAKPGKKSAAIPLHVLPMPPPSSVKDHIL
jgi:hypothetical protein